MIARDSHRTRTAWFGGVLALGASAMFFAALLFGCVYLKVQADEPVPALADGPRGLALLAWGLAALAAAVLSRAGRRRARGGAEPRRSAGGGLAATGIALGIAALAAELAVAGKVAPGATAGAYPALRLTLLGVLGAHAVVVLIGLSAGRVRRAPPDEADPVGRLPPVGASEAAFAGAAFGTWTLAWNYLAVVWTLVTFLAVWR